MLDAFVSVVLTIVSSAAIGWVYKRQYRNASRGRWRYVAIHFASVSTIILSYFWVAYTRFEPQFLRHGTFWLGSTMFVAGSLMFWHSSFVHKTSLVPSKHCGLTETGLYGSIRHPIYSGGILGALGILIVVPSPALLMSFTSLVLSMYVLSKKEEKELLGRLDGYADYLKQTGGFLPRMRLPSMADLPRSRPASWLAVSRLEYLVAGIFFLFVVSMVGSGDPAHLLEKRGWIAWGCMLWAACHLFGSHVNCLADAALDKIYKPRLAHSVAMLGKGRILALCVVESTAALLIAVAFSVKKGSFLPVVFFVIGWVITLMYSIEPIRLKKRGVLSPIALVLVLYGLPVSFGYVALAEQMHIESVLLLVSLGIQMLGIIMMNAAEDAPEDAAHGIRTMVVRYGLRTTAISSLVMYLLGAGGVLWFSGVAKSTSAYGVSALVIATAGYLWVAKSLTRVVLGADGFLLEEKERRRIGMENILHFGITGFTVAILISAPFIDPWLSQMR